MTLPSSWLLIKIAELGMKFHEMEQDLNLIRKLLGTTHYFYHCTNLQLTIWT